MEEINATRAVHVVTLENPVEFVHPHRKATITQREMSTDFEDFASGLRAAMRQAPKVVMITELNDQATMDLALTAAETGHLVLVALRAHDAAQSVARMVNFFEPSEQSRDASADHGNAPPAGDPAAGAARGGGRELIQEISETICA